MPSAATQVFASLESDVAVLIGLHSGSGAPGRPAGNNGPLLRSALVLLVTAWENYVEQVLREAVNHVTPRIKAEPALLSPFLRNAVAHKAKDSVWAVVGDGWLTVASRRLEHEISAFNNAASRQVNELVEQILGVENILDSVSWQAVGPAKAQADLTELVNDIRGEIVHRGTTPMTLGLPDVRAWRNYMANLVKNFDKALSAAVTERYGSCSW